MLLLLVSITPGSAPFRSYTVADCTSGAYMAILLTRKYILLLSRDAMLTDMAMSFAPGLRPWRFSPGKPTNPVPEVPPVVLWPAA